MNYNGHQLCNICVLPQESVADYCPHVSRRNSWFLRAARTLDVVQVGIVALLCRWENNWFGMQYKTSWRLCYNRTTFETRAGIQLPLGRSPNEKQLARELLGIAIRSSQRSSVGDVRTTIFLFRMEKDTLRGIM